MKNYWLIFYWFCRSRTFYFLSYLYEFFADYPCLRWRRVNQAMMELWRKDNAQQYVCSTFNNKGEFIEPYGETPLKTLRRLALSLPIGLGDRVLELGCGRGKVAIWLWAQLGCEVLALDRVEIFVQRGQEIVQNLAISGLSFARLDIQQLPIDEVDWVYLYGIGLSDCLFEELSERFACCTSRARVISIGVDLRDFDPAWKVEQELWCTFAWGWTKAYICRYCSLTS